MFMALPKKLSLEKNDRKTDRCLNDTDKSQGCEKENRNVVPI